MNGWYDRVKTSHSRQAWALLSRYVPAEATVLEIGPGHGHFARQAAALGMVYDAIEPSDFFRRRLEHEGFRVSDEIVPPLPRPSSGYDLVHASMVIENKPDHDRVGDLVAEAARVLKPGGHLSLIFPNYLTWGNFFFDEHYTHSFATTPRRMGHLLESQGFSVVRQEHVLGWFWVSGGPLRTLLRHAVNIGMWPLHTAAARWLLHYLGLGELHWKVRKTFFEAIVMVARKTD